jgi:AAA domain/Bifunctional DNA primase/polymerase, N-terminal
MGLRIRADDHRPDELLQEHGRIVSRLGLAVAWTSGIRGEKAKMAADRGSGAWKRAAPLAGESFAAGLFKERCRLRNPVVAAVASGLVLIDVDGPDELLETVRIELPLTVTARSRRGLHRYYRPDEGMAPGKFQITPDGVDHADDGYLVLPPALHPTGVVYEFVRNGAMGVLPVEAHRRLLALAAATKQRVEEGVREGGKVPEGHRDRFIFLRALEMAHNGLREEEILPSMLVLARDRCEPPLADGLVRKQVQGAVRRAQRKPAVNRELRAEVEWELLAATSPATPAAAPRLGVVPRRRKLAAVQAGQVPPRPLRWLIPGLVPLRAPTLVAGVGGLGKSTYATQIAARLTRAELGVDGDALIVSFEDTIEEVIRPRLEAAGADLDRVRVLRKEGGILTLPDDLDELPGLVAATRTRLLVIDPVSAAISLKLDAHRDQDVRVVLGRLDQLAQEHDLAALLIAHLNKTPSADAYLRVNGSTAFYNACRSVITVTLDPEDDDCRLVAQHKANYSRLAPVERHRIEQVAYDAAGELIVTSKMVFVEEAEGVDPWTVLEHHEPKGRTKRDVAGSFLTVALAHGEWRLRQQIEAMAEAAGVSRRTMYRAGETLGVEIEMRGFPAKAWWRLPGVPTRTTPDLAHLSETA